MWQPAQTLHRIENTITFDRILFALKCCNRVLADDAIRRAAGKLLIIFDGYRQLWIIDAGIRMGLQHIAMLFEIAGRRMSRNQRHDFAQLIVGVAGADRLIERNSDRFTCWRFGLCQFAFQ
ncbi:hypothetical protein D3C81_1888450 [compost metagenome]